MPSFISFGPVWAIKYASDIVANKIEFEKLEKDRRLLIGVSLNALERLLNDTASEEPAIPKESVIWEGFNEADPDLAIIKAHLGSLFEKLLPDDMLLEYGIEKIRWAKDLSRHTIGRAHFNGLELNAHIFTDTLAEIRSLLSDVSKAVSDVSLDVDKIKSLIYNDMSYYPILPEEGLNRDYYDYKKILDSSIAEIVDFVAYIANMYATRFTAVVYHEFLHLIDPKFHTSPSFTYAQTPYKLQDSLHLYKQALDCCTGVRYALSDAAHECWVYPIIWVSGGPLRQWDYPPFEGKEEAAKTLAIALFNTLPGNLTPTEVAMEVNQIGISLHEALFGDEVRAIKSKMPVLETGR